MADASDSIPSPPAVWRLGGWYAVMQAELVVDSVLETWTAVMALEGAFARNHVSLIALVWCVTAVATTVGNVCQFIGLSGWPAAVRSLERGMELHVPVHVRSSLRTRQPDHVRNRFTLLDVDGEPEDPACHGILQGSAALVDAVTADVSTASLESETRPMTPVEREAAVGLATVLRTLCERAEAFVPQVAEQTSWFSVQMDLVGLVTTWKHQADRAGPETAVPVSSAGESVSFLPAAPEKSVQTRLHVPASPSDANAPVSAAVAAGGVSAETGWGVRRE